MLKKFNYFLIITVSILVNFYCVAESESFEFKETQDIAWLKKYVSDNEIEPLRSEPFVLNNKYYLGQALFFDPILSTNKNISCATCHLFSEGSSDALKKSIGTGGVNLGKKRVKGIGEVDHHRNSQALWNLDNNAAKNLFWDGRIEVLDPVRDIYRSPLNQLLPRSLENALAVQALFPVVNEGEMYTKDCQLEGEEQNICERLANLLTRVDKPSWISTYHSMMIDRLLGTRTNTNLNKIQKTYRILFEKAYEDIAIKDIDFGHIGNAIAHFEEIAFATRDAKWDMFIKGMYDSLTVSQQIGGRLFFGEAGCANCHNGPIFSDFNFHSIGIESVKSESFLDRGRGDITKLQSDMFKFRTPLLRNVTLTAPYMHDGSIETLDDAILRHYKGCSDVTIEKALCQQNVINQKVYFKKQLSRSEIKHIINFLTALEDSASNHIEDIIPTKIPSELNIDSMTN